MNCWRLLVFNIRQRWREYQTRDLPLATLMLEMWPMLQERLNHERSTHL